MYNIFFINGLKDLLQNVYPPSLIIAWGISNRIKRFFFKNLITIILSLFRQEITSIHFQI